MTIRHWLRRHPAIYLWLPVLAWMGLIFYLSAQPDLPHPETGWADLLFSSTAHAVIFAVLAVLWARALGGRPRAWLLALVLTLLYALSDELHQAFVPGRTPDPLDLLCDGAGAALGLWCWARLQHGRERARRQ
jgi:VanZ family protein